MDHYDRARIGRMTHPVRGLLHGTAAVVALIGALALTAEAPHGTARKLSLFAFGLSLVTLFVTSSLYHSIPWGPAWKKRMQKLDHTMIYVLVAGTFTPIAVIVLEGWARWTILGIQWGLVAIGALYMFIAKPPRHWVSVALSTTQGWLAVFLLGPLASRLPWTALLMIGLGGVLYTVGMVFLVTGRPKLWPRVFSYHEAFHVLVVAAAAVHFIAIARWVSNYGV